MPVLCFMWVFVAVRARLCKDASQVESRWALVLYVFSADVGKIRTYIHKYIHTYIIYVCVIFYVRQVADC